MDVVSFGDFSEKEVNDLNTHCTDNLEFVWQRRPCSPPVSSNSDSLRRQAVDNATATTPDKQKCSVGGLSPSIPPNPPTSPIEGFELENRSKSPSKLNINAMPFVPGNVSIIVPPKSSSTRNSPTSQSNVTRKLYVGTCEGTPTKVEETTVTDTVKETSTDKYESREETTVTDTDKETSTDKYESREETTVTDTDKETSTDTLESREERELTQNFDVKLKDIKSASLCSGAQQRADSPSWTDSPGPLSSDGPQLSSTAATTATPTNTSNARPPTEQDKDSSLLFYTPAPPHSTQTPITAPALPPTSTTGSLDLTSPAIQSTAQSSPLTIGATPSVWGSKKSWASIVGKQSTSSTSPPSENALSSQPQSAKVTVGVATPGEIQTTIEEKSRNTQLREFAEQLSRWRLSHAPVRIQPRGLVNQGNWCYMHAPLQALLVCPGFFNLFRSLTNSFPALSRDPSPCPISNTMIQFVQEFKPYPKIAPTVVPQPDPKSKKKKARVEFHHGDPFRPDCVYDMLHKIRSNLSFKGRQEDAEEFLGYVLDGLHEEMVAAQNLTQPSVTTETHGLAASQSGVSSASGSEPDKGGEGSESVEWEQVGPKNKSAITRQTSFHNSPITEIFGGELRSSVHRQKAKESATLQPFFSLQLDIQSEEVWTIKDALEALSAKEKIDMSESEAHKRLTLARLPPVLILHLKRFLFDKTGGSQKLLKQVRYSTEMEINKDLLSPAIRNKLSTSQRSYRLWAVVYHHGKTATGGHYTCDTHHPVCGGWVRADDSSLKPVPEDYVLKPAGSQLNKVAYILFYRRLDTISSY